MAAFHDNIGEIERFNPDNYPKMVNEVTLMVDQLDPVPASYKKEMVLSYLKEQGMKNEWILANPNLANLIHSGSLPTAQLEALFQSCRWNKTFRSALERYVKDRLN
jgi:hypothetical protein